MYYDDDVFMILIFVGISFWILYGERISQNNKD